MEVVTFTGPMPGLFSLFTGTAVDGLPEISALHKFHFFFWGGA